MPLPLCCVTSGHLNIILSHPRGEIVVFLFCDSPHPFSFSRTVQHRDRRRTVFTNTQASLRCMEMNVSVLVLRGGFRFFFLQKPENVIEFDSALISWLTAGRRLKVETEAVVWAVNLSKRRQKQQQFFTLSVKFPLIWLQKIPVFLLFFKVEAAPFFQRTGVSQLEGVKSNRIL